MRLDFNVLWVEDNQDNVKSQLERISFALRKEGFRLCVQFASSVDEARTFLSDDIYGDHIDLILMDYDLGPGKKGDEGLVEVKQIMPFKDVVFYSAHTSARLKEMVAARQIQGIYAAYRPDLIDTVYGVFENLVHKVLDIDHSRGIVLGATSEIDEVINLSLDKLFENCDEADKKKCLDFIFERLDSKQTSFTEALSAVRRVTNFNELGEHHGMYTSDDKIRLLRKTLSLVDKQTAYDGQIIKYQNDIAPKRNILAHVRVQKDGFSRKLFDRRGNELTAENMREVRVALLDFQEFFDQLLKDLGTSPA